MVEMPKSGNFRQMAEVEDRVDEIRPEVQPAQPDAPQPVTSTASARALARRRGFVKRAVIAIALLAGTAGAGYYGHYYWTTGRYLESTDDAYMQADYTTIAPKVSGYILKSGIAQSNGIIGTSHPLKYLRDLNFSSRGLPFSFSISIGFIKSIIGV